MYLSSCEHLLLETTARKRAGPRNQVPTLIGCKLLKNTISKGYRKPSRPDLEECDRHSCASIKVLVAGIGFEPMTFGL